MAYTLDTTNTQPKKIRDTHMDKMIFGDMALYAPASARDERLYENAARYVELSSELDTIKEKLAYYKEILAAEFPEEPGEHVVDLDGTRQVTIRIPEKWDWDKKQLSTLFPANATPDCVTTSHTVLRAKYEAAPPEVQDVLKQALTIKCGIPSIKVTQ
mgnify:CR=1 FL=1